MSFTFTESVVEDAALAWLEALGYTVLHGPDISPAGDTLSPALSQRERGRSPAGDTLTLALSQRERGRSPIGDTLTPALSQRERGRSPAGDTLTPALSQRERGELCQCPSMKDRPLTFQSAETKSIFLPSLSQITSDRDYNEKTLV
ncbi:hypothetical protein [Candidatus Nitrospira salsa]